MYNTNAACHPTSVSWWALFMANESISPTQSKNRSDAKLDKSLLTGLAFFVGQNRTKKHKAAILLAEDELTGEEIARKLGMSRSTLYEWRADPEFQQIIGQYAGVIIAESLKLPIAKKHERIKGYNALNEAYWEIKRLRGERNAEEIADTPEQAVRLAFGDVTPAEASTGMLLRQPKISANGKTVVEWAFDKPLDSAIKETYKQAAQELGQWVDQSSVGIDQTITTIRIIGED